MPFVPRSLALAIACAFFVIPSSAQQGTAPAPPPMSQGAPITSDTKLVTMLAAVRDKKGTFVRTLTRDDFSLQQDGHPQSITYFVQDPHAPLVIGLLVDTSLSQRHVLDQERGASGEFLDRMFDFADAQSVTAQPAAAQPTKTTTAAAPAADKDKAFIVRFDFEVELMQDVTPNREKLENALRAIDTPEFTGSQPSNDPNDPNSPDNTQRTSHHRGGHGAGTLLYDAIYLSTEDITRKQEGRKALVILTDGDDRGSKESLENAIEAAQRSDTVVYSILFRDEDEYNNAGRGGGMHGGYGGGGGGGGHRGGGGYPQQEQRPDGKKVLERISKETGGKFFEVTKKQSIGDIYAAINDELRSQYSIAYKPEPADAGPGYHKIQLAAKPKDLSVQTREGYYAK
jgi:VWFA-related protein